MTDQATTTNLTASQRRAIGDYASHTNYRGQAASGEALRGLEAKGLVYRIEIAADRKPIYLLTTKGQRIAAKLNA